MKYSRHSKHAMNGTPRLRSAYPSTPASGQERYDRGTNSARPQGPRSPISQATSLNTNAPTPVIPFTMVDAPSQRLYVALFYSALTIWRLYDYIGLVSDGTESLWIFMKWLAIDSVFLYGLPEFQIPWLQWSSSTTAILVILHTILNAFLMFRIPVCLALCSNNFEGIGAHKQIDSHHILVPSIYESHV